jgi:hypothetical protein
MSETKATRGAVSKVKVFIVVHRGATDSTIIAVESSLDDAKGAAIKQLGARRLSTGGDVWIGEPSRRRSLAGLTSTSSVGP